MWYRSEFVNSENYFKYKGKYKNWNISATKTDLAKSLFREKNFEKWTPSQPSAHIVLVSS